mmetsp:Transcript_14027/g.39696  ORF Transcript_14027/g.39696 Transcript_14027/m.39696 type:complete len:200 (-) Transcript_14027:2552-3151(-)
MYGLRRRDVLDPCGPRHNNAVGSVRELLVPPKSLHGGRAVRCVACTPLAALLEHLIYPSTVKWEQLLDPSRSDAWEAAPCCVVTIESAPGSCTRPTRACGMRAPAARPWLCAAQWSGRCGRATTFYRWCGAHCWIASTVMVPGVRAHSAMVGEAKYSPSLSRNKYTSSVSKLITAAYRCMKGLPNNIGMVLCMIKIVYG